MYIWYKVLLMHSFIRVTRNIKVDLQGGDKMDLTPFWTRYYIIHLCVINTFPVFSLLLKQIGTMCSNITISFQIKLIITLYLHNYHF